MLNIPAEESCPRAIRSGCLCCERNTAGMRYSPHHQQIMNIRCDTARSWPTILIVPPKRPGLSWKLFLDVRCRKNRGDVSPRTLKNQPLFQRSLPARFAREQLERLGGMEATLSVVHRPWLPQKAYLLFLVWFPVLTLPAPHLQ